MNTDLELVNATLTGDKSSFEALVLRYQTQVYRLVYRIIDNQSDASDIVQESLLKAYQNLGTLRDRGRFSFWLFRIAKNQCISWNRKYQKNLQKSLTDVEHELVNSRLHLPPAPDEALMERELHRQVMKAISRLPKYNREAATMFYLEGKSYSEIQDELGITKGTLGRFLYEARAQLRERLQAFHQIALFWLGGGLKRVFKLSSEKAGTTANVTTVSAGKCLIISGLLHVLFFAGISTMGLHWGIPGEAISGPDYTSVIKASLVEIPLSEPDPAQAKTLEPFQDAESRTAKGTPRDPLPYESLENRVPQTVSIPTELALNPASRATVEVPRFTPTDPATAFLDLAANIPALATLPAAAEGILTIQPGKGLFHDRVAGPGILRRFHQNQGLSLDAFSIAADTLFSPPIAISDSPEAERTPPNSHSLFYQYDRMVKNTQEVLKELRDRGRIEQYSASAIQFITRTSPYSIILVAECDLEVLKALVALGLPPVVIMRSPVGPKHIRAIVGYDDSTERITMVDSDTKAIFSYSEFSSQWDDPQDACLLVFHRRVAPKTIKMHLTRYLPLEKIESISIREPRSL